MVGSVYADDIAARGDAYTVASLEGEEVDVIVPTERESVDSLNVNSLRAGSFAQSLRLTSLISGC